ncbi:MAG: amidohydrolase family protein, partial [Eubacteriales bacterium]
KYQNIKPIITPRFTPSCTDELMKELAVLQAETKSPLQSHLSENEGEIQWVQALSPESKFYGDAYDRCGAFGSNGSTVMAHCVHSDEQERKLMKERGVYVAHCPESNTNLSSGIAPARAYLEEGINIGLGSDVAGGHELSMFRVIKAAIQVSKLRWRLVDQSQKPLSMEEAFYMATKGGGSFFGKVGSFEEGYEVDALVLDDSRLNPTMELSSANRLERLIYSIENQDIKDIYVAGKKLN